MIAESRATDRARHFDISGALAATIGLSLLVLGIVRTDVTGWGSAPTLALILGGLGLLGVFLFIEGKIARSPLMPLRIFASRQLSAANLSVLAVGAASFGMWFFVSLYLQQVLGYSPIRAGLAFLPMTVCIVIGSTLASRLVQRIGVRPILTLGLVLQVAGLLLFALIHTHGTYLGDVLAPSLLVAMGIGLSFVPAAIAAVSGVAPHEAGLASGLVNTSRLFGGALGLALLAAIATARTHADARLGDSAHAALTSGFQIAFVVAAAFAAVGALVAFFGLPRQPRVRTELPAAEAEAA
jgi:MFS family permease